MRGKRICDLDIINIVTSNDFMILETTTGTFKISTNDVNEWLKSKLIPEAKKKIPPIVNNCIEGGVNKTLSAEQGKILMEKIESILENIGEEILTTDSQTIKGAINELNSIVYTADKIKYTHHSNPNILNVKDALDYLLYKKPNLIISSSKSLINEIGTDLIDVDINWSYNPNLIDSQKFNGEIIEKSVRTKNIPSINRDKIISIEGKDKYNTITNSISFKFYNGVYYGVSDLSIEISNLSKSIQPNRQINFTVNSTEGKYIYFAIPVRYGEPAFFVGGFEGGFVKAETKLYRNPSGYEERYNIYRSVRNGLGSTTVNVR